MTYIHFSVVVLLLLAGVSWSRSAIREGSKPTLTPDPVGQSNKKHSPAQTPKNDRDETGSNSFDPLPEHPLQLVRPDPNEHRKLEIVEAHLKHLHYVTNAVAVVTVVGTYHSGKSFLLNQLMGKRNGFGIGPTVQPQTMGIWMWGRVSSSVCLSVKQSNKGWTAVMPNVSYMKFRPAQSQNVM